MSWINDVPDRNWMYEWPRVRTRPVGQGLSPDFRKRLINTGL
jgi:hypothetical protein